MTVLIRNRLTGSVIQSLPVSSLAGANLSNLNLAFADLAGIDLTATNLANADLFQASLRNSILNGASLRNVFALQTNFAQTNLTSADLTGAFCLESDFSSANFSSATLMHAAFPESNFTLASNITAFGSDFLSANLSAIKTAFFSALADIYQENIIQLRAGFEAGDISAINGAFQLDFSDLDLNSMDQSDVFQNAIVKAWLTGIQPSDTPYTNLISQQSKDWLNQFLTQQRS